MEFPDEILRIIKEYSQPRFKYFREYKRLMRISGIVRWPLLKKGLLEKGDKILSYVLAYEQALRDCSLVLWGSPIDHSIRRRARTKALNDLVHAL